MKLNSLRLRFALWLGSLLLVSLCLFGLYVYIEMKHNLNASIDDALRLSATQSISTLHVESTGLVLPDKLPGASTDLATLEKRGFTVRFLNPEGRVLGGFGADWNAPWSIAPSGEQSFFVTSDNIRGKSYRRVFTMPVINDRRVVGFVQISQSLETVEDTLENLRLVLSVGIPFLTLFAMLGGYFLASHALKPVAEITATARRISAEDLSARLNLPNSGDELGQLAATFDTMLARLENSFHRERQFTLDASHELRTPLAAMQAIISVTRSKNRSTMEYEKALDDLAEETNHLRSLTEDLLVLARGQQPVTVKDDQVDLSALLLDVAESLTPLAEANGLSVETRIQPNLVIKSDRDRLIRLFVNLVDNAIKFTESGKVMMRTSIGADCIQIAVSDTGKGIAQEHLEHVFDRFYRVNTSRSQRGAGLGLSIARELAQTCRGDISVNSEMGMGTTFTVTLPTM